jgi:signal transduction histidine kinase
VGIPEAKVSKLFHRIVRPELETIRSTGLVLYLVENLVEGMAGTVDVETTEGVGSQFIIWFPLPESDRQAA